MGVTHTFDHGTNAVNVDPEIVHRASILKDTAPFYTYEVVSSLSVHNSSNSFVY